ncbi:MAG: hypothetical protein QM724_14040 [Flavobacteriales bacterium]
MHSVTVRRPEGPVRARIALPRSKSVANRALVLAALAGDLACVQDPGDAEDTRLLAQLLRERPFVMHCGLGGTTFRFLLAWACVQEGEEHVITGAAGLLERPHQPLIEALRHLGAAIDRTDAGYRVRGKRLAGGTITFDSPISSQYLSALMLVAPRMAEGLRIEWTGTQLSRPYVGMTVRALRVFGIAAEVDAGTITVPPGTLMGVPFSVPRDWSAAAFWFEVVALAHDAEVVLEDLRADGWQGDERITEFMRGLVHAEAGSDGLRLSKAWDGVDSLRFELDGTPDLFQPLVFTWVNFDARMAFDGLHNLSRKETDRTSAVAEVLKELGIASSFSQGQFRVLSHEPPVPIAGHAFHTYKDHRMAMALAPLALAFGEITLLDPDVVGKSYPGFWEDLRKAGFSVVFNNG